MRRSLPPAALVAAILLLPGPAEAGLLDLLFGRSPARAPVAAPSGPAPAPGFATEAPGAPRASRRAGGSGGSKAVCVRLCDGYYYPLDGVATRAGNSQADCEQSCPGAGMGVFRVSGDAMAEARDGSGRRYADLPAAFSYRTTVVPACSCQAASLRTGVASDMTLRTGDIVVTADGAVVFRGSEREAHRPSDFADIHSPGALKGAAFALADRVLGFSFQEGQARKAAVQLAARPPQEDIVVTPLRTGSVSAGARAEAQAPLGPSGARVILPMPAPPAPAIVPN